MPLWLICPGTNVDALSPLVHVNGRVLEPPGMLSITDAISDLAAKEL